MAHPSLTRSKTLRRQVPKPCSRSADFDVEDDYYCDMGFEFPRLSSVRHHDDQHCALNSEFPRLSSVRRDDAAGGGTLCSSLAYHEDECFTEWDSEDHSSEWDSDDAATCDGLTTNRTHFHGPSFLTENSVETSWEEPDWVPELADSAADAFVGDAGAVGIVTLKHWLENTGEEEQQTDTGKDRIEKGCGDNDSVSACEFSFAIFETCDSHGDCEFSFASCNKAIEANDWPLGLAANLRTSRTSQSGCFMSDTFAEAKEMSMAWCPGYRRPKAMSAPAVLQSAPAVPWLRAELGTEEDTTGPLNPNPRLPGKLDPWVRAELGTEEEDPEDLLRGLDSCFSAFSSREIQEKSRKMGQFPRRRLRNLTL